MTHPADSRRIDRMDVLSIREASMKYNVPLKTLRNWVADGLVRVFERAKGPGLPTLIFESDVAALATHYKPGRGRWRRRDLQEAIRATG